MKKQLTFLIHFCKCSGRINEKERRFYYLLSFKFISGNIILNFISQLKLIFNNSITKAEIQLRLPISEPSFPVFLFFFLRKKKKAGNFSLESFNVNKEGIELDAIDKIEKI